MDRKSKVRQILVHLILCEHPEIRARMHRPVPRPLGKKRQAKADAATSKRVEELKALVRSMMTRPVLGRVESAVSEAREETREEDEEEDTPWGREVYSDDEDSGDEDSDDEAEDGEEEGMEDGAPVPDLPGPSKVTVRPGKRTVTKTFKAMG